LNAELKLDTLHHSTGKFTQLKSIGFRIEKSSSELITWIWTHDRIENKSYTYGFIDQFRTKALLQ